MENKSVPFFLEAVAEQQSAALGVMSAIAGNRLREVNGVLENINRAYLDELARNPNANRFSPEFYAQRQQLFGQLDNAANRLVMSRVNISQYNKVKHTLGLSTKSILHNADDILAGGQIPELGERINRVSAAARGAKALGWLGVGIDGGVRLNRINEACTADSGSECSVVKYQQFSGFLWSAGFGAAGGLAGAKAAAAVVSFVFAVTAGSPVLVIAAVAGAGYGAYQLGKQGGNFGEFLGEKLYELRASND